MRQGDGIEDHLEERGRAPDVILGSAADTAVEQGVAVATSAQVFQHGKCAGKRKILVCTDAAAGSAARQLWCASGAAHGVDWVDYSVDLPAGEEGGAEIGRAHV